MLHICVFCNMNFCVISLRNNLFKDSRYFYMGIQTDGYQLVFSEGVVVVMQIQGEMHISLRHKNKILCKTKQELAYEHT